jgi:5'-nucleotidase
MHILVTNDDGVQSPGLLALVEELRKLGKVSVLAPNRNWSAGGHVKTLDRPLRVEEVRLADGSTALTSDGAPSDCVSLALHGLVELPLDLVVSGINTNANLGYDLTYSGTVTAAMEAILKGIPGIAVSQETPDLIEGKRDFASAAAYGRIVAQAVLANGLPPSTLLNLNVPYLSMQEIKGVRITRQGKRLYRDTVVRGEDPHKIPYYWIGGEMPVPPSLENSDSDALAEGYVSVTPLQMDLTDYKMIESLRDWQFGE